MRRAGGGRVLPRPEWVGREEVRGEWRGRPHNSTRQTFDRETFLRWKESAAMGLYSHYGASVKVTFVEGFIEWQESRG